jgi:hypothetical protein
MTHYPVSGKIKGETVHLFTAEAALALHQAREREIQKRIRLASTLPRPTRRRPGTRRRSAPARLRPAV